MHSGSTSERSKVWLPLKIFLAYILLTISLAGIVFYSRVGGNAAALGLLVLQYLSPWPIFFLVVFLHFRSGNQK